LLSPELATVSLLLITFIFALNHLNLGAIHVLAKAILGVICLLTFIFTQTIIMPLFIHATFNALVIHKYKKLGYV
jgi:membrane protease YdiL (CAAX protease family)